MDDLGFVQVLHKCLPFPTLQVNHYSTLNDCDNVYAF